MSYTRDRLLYGGARDSFHIHSQHSLSCIQAILVSVSSLANPKRVQSSSLAPHIAKHPFFSASETSL